MGLKNINRYSLFFFLMIMLPVSIYGAEPVLVGSDFTISQIGMQTDVLMDPSQELSLDNIVSEPYQSRFTQNQSTGFNFGMAGDVIWLRFKIAYSGNRDKNKKLVLALDSPTFLTVDLYMPVGQEAVLYKKILNGYLRFSKGQTWEYRYPVFKLGAIIPENQYLFLRITPKNATNHASSNFLLSLSDEDRFRKKTWFEISFYFLMFGVLASMILYNSFLSLFLKDKVYYLYVCYITFLLSYLFLRNGFANLAGLWGLTSFVLYFVSIAYIFGILFSISFLGLRKHTPVLYLILWGLICLTFLVIPLMVFRHPTAANQLMHLVAVIGPLILFSAGIIRFRQGYKPARYYIVAWFLVLTGVTCFALVGLGKLPKTFFTLNALTLGSTLEAVLLSTALADRIRILRREKKMLQKKERRLTELSIKDELTGLFNKRWFSSKLLSEIEHNARVGESVSLIILDVDHFKQFNDTYGHTAGDMVLAKLGRLINDNIREHDIPCRYGGEEFAVIMPATGIEKAYCTGERLRKVFESSTVQLDAGNHVQATISVGVGQLSEDEGEKNLFDKVDRAMYKAKYNGRNQVVKAV